MKLFQLAVTATLALLGGHADAVSTFSPARPPAAPLAVRTPYLNVWLSSTNNGNPILPGTWPTFWTQGIKGWQGLVMVDGKAYNWMGNAPGPPTVDQLHMQYTSTRTIITMSVANQVELDVEFLSPFYVGDFKRQSIPFSYMQVTAKSTDGRSHHVQVYADVSGEWASGDNSKIIQWETDTKEGVRYHKFYRQDQNEFNEDGDSAAWGNWYWATGDQRGVSYQIGEDVTVRGQFMNNGTLTNNVDTNYRAISDRWPVFAFSRDLGQVASGKSVSTLFTIGYAQDNAILFQGQGDTPASIPSLWKSYLAEDELVPFFYKDYDYATHYANRMDIRIQRDSEQAAGQDYATITTLAARQTFGGLQFCGTPDHPYLFLKEISSDSDIQTVDVIFPPFPLLMYFDATWVKYLLAPLLENDRYHYPNKYAQHDLGRYPRALGYPAGNDEAMPLEECGNMIIMMLAYAQAKHDDQYLADNWDLLTQWAQYLIEEAKIPANQISTDDFAGSLANQTDLAIKGIIALEAMSKIAPKAGHKDQSAKYSDLAHEYYDFWTQHAINNASNPRHTTLAYDKMDTYGLLYNIYADKILKLGFIPQELFDMQSDYYYSVQRKYGVILDTRNTLTKVDWEMYAAAGSKPETQQMFVSKIAKWINETPTFRPFTDLYETETGGHPNTVFYARPVVGGVFALLALNL